MKRGRSEDSSPSRKQAKRAASSPVEIGDTVEGVRIVITGVTTVIPRLQFERKLRDAGAQLTSAVSGVTQILVYGPTLEDGREYKDGSKFIKATDLINSGKSKVGLTIMSEREFFKTFEYLAPSSTIPEMDENLAPSSEHFMWAEKWRPRTGNEFAFNREAYNSLVLWLEGWDASSDKEKAALLCGPPGVGKTSACLALANQLGYKLVELNASDTRSMKQLKTIAPLVTGGASLSKGEVQNKVLLLMDEADGLSTGDRGGAQELTRMIRNSKVPIMCTCNDSSHPKVRTLAKSCRVMQFTRPDNKAATRRVMDIAQKEGFNVSASFVEATFDATGGDMRQLLNAVQMAMMSASTSSPTVSKFVLKDQNLSDDAKAGTQRLFSRRDLSWRQRLQIFFSDYDMVPILVQDTYLRAVKPNDGILKAQDIASTISFGETMNRKIRSENQWSLLPDVGWFSTVYPTSLLAGGGVRMDFPRLLGRISSANKHSRQLGELGNHTGRSGNKYLADGYYDLMGEELVKPLHDDDLSVPERVEEFLQMIGEYRLTKDLVTDNLMDVRNSKNLNNPFGKVDTKTKTALTRAITAAGVPGGIVHSTRKKASKKPSPASVPDEEEDFTQVDEKEEEEKRMGSIY